MGRSGSKRAGHLDQGMSERQQKELLNGAMSYQVISDKDALAKADTTIKEDFPAAVSHWQDIINSGTLINVLNSLLLFFGISLVKMGYICYNLFVRKYI